MPQPYRGKEKVRFGYEAILERPALAAHIGAIATLWTVIEEGWGVILANILDADAKVGVAMYLSLTGSAAQAHTLRAVAEHALEDEALRAEFGDLLKGEKDAGRERNRVVHGRWGILPSREDVLILGERDWTTKVTAVLNHHYSRPFNPFNPEGPDIPQFNRSRYDERDFRAIERRLAAFQKKQSAFATKLRAANLARRGDLKTERGPAPPLQSALVAPNLFRTTTAG